MTKTDVMARLAQVTKTQGDHVGDMTWADFGGVLVERQKIRDSLKVNGLPETLIGEDVSVRRAFGDAVRDWRQGARKYKLDRQYRGNSVRILRATDDKINPYVTCATLVPNETDDKIDVDATHEFDDGAQRVLDEVMAAYNKHRYYADSTEVGSMISGAIQGWFSGIRLSRSGKPYWVPSINASSLYALQSALEFIDGLTFNIIPIHDSQQGRLNLAQNAAADFMSRVKDVEKRLDEYEASGRKTKAVTLEDRLEDFEDLREKVDLYTDLLAAKRDKLIDKLNDATERCRKMLAVIDAEDED
jgi:hypothetical protein